MTSYLPRFDAEFAAKLTKRAKTFRLMFEMLEKLNKKSLFIVETGCVRDPECWDGDGCSTILLNDFVWHHGDLSQLNTVDINPEHIEVAKNVIDPHRFGGGVSFRAMTHLEDSVRFLAKHTLEIDLLYLDSYDFDPSNPHPSSLHHLKELAAAQKNLRPGSIICVDDNHPDGTGKGAYVRDYLHNLGIDPIADEYQVVWVWK